MSNEVKRRLYITLVAISLLWLLCMGVINLIQVQDTRSLALSACLKDNSYLLTFATTEQTMTYIQHCLTTLALSYL